MIDLLIEAGLPESQEAERMVLGSVLAHHAQFDTLAAALEADDFSSERHRRIFARMADLSTRGESINRMTVWTELENNGQAEHNGFTYVCSLDEQLPENRGAR